MTILHNYLFLPLNKVLTILFFIFLQGLLYGQSNQYVITQFNSENGLPQNSVKFIQFGKDGFCWLGTETGLVRFDNKHFKSYSSDIIKGLNGERISAMLTDTSGNLFIQTLNQENLKITGSSSLFSSVPKLTGNDFSFVSIGYIQKNKLLDSLWVSIFNKNNIPILKKAVGLRNGDIYSFLGSEAYFISNNKIKALEPNKEEPQGSLILNDHYYLQLWKGNRIKTWHKGISQIGYIDGDLEHNDDYLKGAFKALWCEEGAYIYAGGSLYEVFYKKGRVTSKVILSGLNLAVPLSIAYRPDINTYYIGTGTQGLFTIKASDFIYPSIPEKSGPENYYTLAKTSTDDIITNNVIIKPDNSSAFTELNNQDSRASYTDGQDRVYYESNFSLYRYSTRNGILEKDLLLLDNRLLDIVPDITNETLLLCTHTSLYKVLLDGSVVWQKKFPPGIIANGLIPLKHEQYLLLTSTGLKWYDLQKNDIIKTILDSLPVRTVYRDKANRLWIGTDGKGSFLYNQNKLYALPKGPRNAFKSIHSFIEDENHNFWLPTNNGLYHIPIKALTDFTLGYTNSIFWITFDQKNGLRTTEFNGGANPNFQRLHDGALLLPSINGLVKFYPNLVRSAFPQEKIFIDEINIDGVINDLDHINRKILLKPTFQSLNIKVTCPYFGNIENLKLEYKIGTEDGQWLPVPSSGIISINRLPANEYTLAVRKAGTNSKTIYGSILIEIEVRPFFYQTWWFFLGILVITLSCAIWYSRRRFAKMEKEKLKIEKIVTRRTIELNTAIQELEQSQHALKNSNEVKEQIIATVLHDVKSPLYTMRVTAKALEKNWEVDMEENLKQVKGLNQLIGELNRFTDQFFSWAGSQQVQFTVKKTNFPLQQIFDDIEALFKEIVFINHNTLDIPSTDIECFTDKDILILILRNLVDNANKSTEGGRITITASTFPEGLKIQVSDTGKGLNEFQIENFLNKDKAVKNGRMGSIIILDMLHIINGELFIDSLPEKGALFTIHLYYPSNR